MMGGDERGAELEAAARDDFNSQLHSHTDDLNYPVFVFGCLCLCAFLFFVYVCVCVYLCVRSLLFLRVCVCVCVRARVYVMPADRSRPYWSDHERESRSIDPTVAAGPLVFSLLTDPW